MAPRRRLTGAIIGTLSVLLALGCAACEKPVPEGRFLVTIKGERFYLEPAVTQQQQSLGLGGRDSIDPDGGMIFYFPVPQQREFVMRDCLVPIDLAFTDDTGRIVALHAMTVEPPRAEGESDMQYELRLKRYPSRYRVRVAIEVAGGTWARLGLAEGDRVSFDADKLKDLARRADPAR